MSATDPQSGQEKCPALFQAQEEIRSCSQVEAMIDETVDQSFPASDPPAWGALARKCEASRGERESAAVATGGDEECDRASDDKERDATQRDAA